MKGKLSLTKRQFLFISKKTSRCWISGMFRVKLAVLWLLFPEKPEHVLFVGLHAGLVERIDVE